MPISSQALCLARQWNEESRLVRVTPFSESLHLSYLLLSFFFGHQLFMFDFSGN
jgi:hypothetical protein